MKALVIRILRQMGNDRRTLVLMIAAPILILSLLYLLLGEGSYIPRIAVAENFPAALMTELKKQDVEVIVLPDDGNTVTGADTDMINDALLKEKSTDAVVTVASDGIHIRMLEAGSSKTASVSA